MDGVQKKFALIVNDSQDPESLKEVDRALQALQRDGDFHVNVVSPQVPKGVFHIYASRTDLGLSKVLEGLSKRADGDDLLIVYTTGDGKENTDGEACLNLAKICLPLSKYKKHLEKLGIKDLIQVYGKAYSGHAYSLFAKKEEGIVTKSHLNFNKNVICERLDGPKIWDRTPRSDLPDNHTLSIKEHFLKKTGNWEFSCYPHLFVDLTPVWLYEFFGKAPTYKK